MAKQRKSKEREERIANDIIFRSRESDAFKDRVCKEIGLPLLRLSASEYPAGELANLGHHKLLADGPG